MTATSGRHRGPTRWFPHIAWGLCHCNGAGYLVDLNGARHLCARCKGTGAPHRVRAGAS